MHTEGNLASQIHTGEGKSFITALFAAWELFKSDGPVDVCSANTALAHDDFEKLSPFFEYIGIDTRLITQQSEGSDYAQKGINYSTVSDMSLYRQKIAMTQNT